MNYKKIAAVLAAAAIIGSSCVLVPEAYMPNGVVTVSASSSLRLNSTGSEVTQLQNNLIRLGYLKSGSAGGTYDVDTENAVRQFQSDYRLTADGIAGSKTLSLIDSIVNGSVNAIEVNTALLNVRSSASKSGRILTTVKSGQKFIAEGQSTDSGGTKWYKITTDSGVGYICAEYAKSVTVGQNPDASSQAASGKLRIAASALNVREGASTSSKKVFLADRKSVV